MTQSTADKEESTKDHNISVVIPCLNEESAIGHLLEAVRLQDLPLHQVIVVDTGSTDGTMQVLRTLKDRHPGFPLVFTVRPQGTIPEAMNAGVAASTGDIIVRLDAHSIPIDAYIRLSVEALLQTGAGVVGGVWKIVPGGDGTIARAITQAVSHPLGAGDAAYRIGAGSKGRKPVDTVPFGCYLRTTWERIGGYNEDLLTNEDYEFNYRVRSNGMTVLLDSDIRCTYVARSSLRELAKQYFRYGWWKAQMLKQHPQSLRWRQAIPVLFVAALAVLACGSFLLEPARWLLALQVGFYALVLGAVSLLRGLRAGDWTTVPLLPAAFATVHMFWGIGMLTNLLTLGRWPKWSRRDRPA